MNVLPDDTESRLRSVLDDVRALPPRERFGAASELVEKLRGRMAEAGEIRAGALKELQESGKGPGKGMSISEVARHVGITKSRAQDILRRAS